MRPLRAIVDENGIKGIVKQKIDRVADFAGVGIGQGEAVFDVVVGQALQVATGKTVCGERVLVDAPRSGNDAGGSPFVGQPEGSSITTGSTLLQEYMHRADTSIDRTISFFFISSSL